MYVCVCVCMCVWCVCVRVYVHLCMCVRACVFVPHREFHPFWNCFGNHFASVYVNSSDNLDAINEFNLSYTELPKDNSIINLNSSFSVEIVDKCVKLLKCGTSTGPYGLMAEHIPYSNPIIIIHMCYLLKQ